MTILYYTDTFQIPEYLIHVKIFNNLAAVTYLLTANCLTDVPK